MRVIDLTHAMHTGMPVFPGDEPVNMRRTRFVSRDGYAVTGITATTHAGTHVDMPAHLFADGAGLDDFGPDRFVGQGTVVNCTGVERIKAGSLAWLESVQDLDFVLLRTGWDQYWKTEHYFEGYPILEEEACRYLCGLGLKGVGLDTPSPDPLDGSGLPAHRMLMEHDLVIAENLCHLDLLPPEGFLFSCLPLRIREGDGSPVRAVGLIL
ncbi:cyclase family protein [Pseudodesulfovibrio cashew]|uniref:Cyclase family protein n=1 Tax=Pseudodesulfovibrio cashew TaxID=2678688 RepID=A0A6I6JF34_9BACT|nr:cyclase family protein [Pseudodesulfovibrio cashew]QGY39700.1 cyclase family protein [Pseudodesulfovibrio cashew]